MTTEEIFNDSVFGHSDELGFNSDTFNATEMVLFGEICRAKERKEIIDKAWKWIGDNLIEDGVWSFQEMERAFRKTMEE